MAANSYPLQWPAGWPRTAPEPARYKATYRTVTDHLQSELRLLGADHLIVSSNVPVRRDGMPYTDMASDRIPDPGVAVYFLLEERQQVIACDRWDKPKDNMRAVGLTIAAMRQIQRTGASELFDRAFAGFTALPAPGSDWKTVLEFPDRTPTADEVKSRFKHLAKRDHPDHGGSTTAMQRLVEARDAALRAIQ